MERELTKALAKEQQKIENALRACGYTIETIQFTGPRGLNIPALFIKARFLEEEESRFQNPDIEQMRMRILPPALYKKWMRKHRKK